MACCWNHKTLVEMSIVQRHNLAYSQNVVVMCNSIISTYIFTACLVIFSGCCWDVHKIDLLKFTVYSKGVQLNALSPYSQHVVMNDDVHQHKYVYL
jgi:hypothetical protein